MNYFRRYNLCFEANSCVRNTSLNNLQKFESGRHETVEGRHETVEGRHETVEGRHETVEGRQEFLCEFVY
jgi:hypothetical protein